MIRAYQPADTNAIIEVWYQASAVAHPFLSAPFLAQEADNIRNIYLPNTKTWVYELDGQIVGFIGMIDNEVGAIFINPQHHRKGIGQQLMNWVAQMHEALEVEVFKANAIGRAFYQKYGFTFLKEGFHEPSQQAILRLRFERPL